MRAPGPAWLRRRALRLPPRGAGPTREWVYVWAIPFTSVREAGRGFAVRTPTNAYRGGTDIVQSSAATTVRASAMMPRMTQEAVATPPSFTLRANLKVVAYWITLGAAAGGLGGALVGGVGGRLAMFLLRLTSDDSVRGIESDDGFIIGRFDLSSTMELMLITTILGAAVGLVVAFGRPFFPRRGMPFAWGLAGALIGGSIIVRKDGVDFNLLDPASLAIIMFIAIPALGAALIAWLVELYPRFWVRRRWCTGLAALAAIPIIVGFPIVIAAVVIGVIWSAAMLFPELRSLPDRKPVRIAAFVVFAVIVTPAFFGLVDDVRAIL